MKRRPAAAGPALLLLLALPCVAFAAADELGGWGKPNRGLRLGLALDPAGEKHAEPPRFVLTLHNAGEEALLLNLGAMLANGRKQYIEEVALSLTGPDGRTRRIKIESAGRAAGRVDDLIVPLPPGTSYVVRMDLKHCWCPDRLEFDLKLEPGAYTVAASFDGKPAVNVQGDMKGVALFGLWRGRVESAAIKFEIAAPAPPANAKPAPPPAAPAEANPPAAG